MQRANILSLQGLGSRYVHFTPMVIYSSFNIFTVFSGVLRYVSNSVDEAYLG